MSISKTRSSFYRRLYLAWLIDQGLAVNVPALMALTGMPRRTAQDTLQALEELDIDCRFEQEQGERNNAGHYRIASWGPINSSWVQANIIQLAQALGYPVPEQR